MCRASRGGQRHGRREPAARPARHRQFAGPDCGGLADRHEPDAPARRRCQDVLLLRPFAGEVRLAVRQPERSFRAIDGLGVAQLLIALERRLVAKRQRVHGARSRIVAMRAARHLDGRAPDEHLRRPARAPERRGRPHLAFHRDDLAVGSDDIEIDIRMRVDEVEPRQPALELHLLARVVAPGAVVRLGAFDEHRHREQGGDEYRVCHSCHLCPPRRPRRSDHAANSLTFTRTIAGVSDLMERQ